VDEIRIVLKWAPASHTHPVEREREEGGGRGGRTAGRYRSPSIRRRRRAFLLPLVDESLSMATTQSALGCQRWLSVSFSPPTEPYEKTHREF